MSGILISKYRIHIEYKGQMTDYGLKAGQRFDATITVNFETGFVQIDIPLPEDQLTYQYRNFNHLEEYWFIHGIYKEKASKG